MEAATITILIGASIIRALENNMNMAKIKVIAKSGLTFNSNKMKEIVRSIQQACQGHKSINIAMHPLGNNLFPGIPRGKCYLKGPKPRPAIEMADYTICFLRNLEKLLPKDAKVKFNILPGMTRRRSKCSPKCKVCISYPHAAAKLARFENRLKLNAPDNFTVISINQFSKFLQNKANSTRSVRKLLIQTDYRLRTEKISAFEHLKKQYSLISGMLVRCRAHSKKVYNTDKTHTCCPSSRNALAKFIRSALSQPCTII